VIVLTYMMRAVCLLIIICVLFAVGTFVAIEIERASRRRRARRLRIHQERDCPVCRTRARDARSAPGGIQPW
jgi:hypothetical protein